MDSKKVEYPTFLGGLASIFDITGSMGSYYNPNSKDQSCEDPAERDAEALAATWKAVGDDLYRAMGIRPVRNDR